MKLCACLNEDTIEKCITLSKKTKADLFEHRIDYLTEVKNLDTLYSLDKEFIATCRSINCGGQFSGSEEKRIGILIKAIDSGARLVDIEIETKSTLLRKVVSYAKSKNCKVIISMHNFSHTPNKSRLMKILRTEKRLGANIGKIVCYAKSVNDAHNLLELIFIGKKIGLPVISFGMGEVGKFSRIISLIYGAPFTFVSINKKTASGQYSLKEINRLLKGLVN